MTHDAGRGDRVAGRPAPTAARSADRPTHRQAATSGDEPAARGLESSGDEPAARGQESSGDEPAARGQESSGDEPAARGHQSSGDEPAARGQESSGDEPAARGQQGSGDEGAVRGHESSGDEPAARGHECSGDEPAARGHQSSGGQPAARGRQSSGDEPAARGQQTSGDEGAVVSWRALLADVVARLAGAGIDNAAQEARWLVERATGRAPAEVAASLDEPAAVRAATHVHAMAARRAAGEPLQYAMQRWAFRSLDLFVDRRVLIPRPETEVLAEMTLAECRRLDARVAVDLGTGSGAMALALAVERPGLEVWGTDVSEGALAVARANLAGLGRAATRVRLVAGDWFGALPGDLAGRVDVIVTNPPYVADGEMADLPAEVRDWEPHEALRAGPTGLEDVERIVAAAPGWLARPGALLVELAPHQAARARALALAAGFSSATVWPDLTGRDRIVLARL